MLLIFIYAVCEETDKVLGILVLLDCIHFTTIKCHLSKTSFLVNILPSLISCVVSVCSVHGSSILLVDRMYGSYNFSILLFSNLSTFMSEITIVLSFNNKSIIHMNEFLRCNKWFQFDFYVYDYIYTCINTRKQSERERQTQRETESLSSDHFYKPLIDYNILL